jgi:glycosyltransferase involved in cell wall biosynthesis
MSTARMARLYHAADCYVSSYLAEGFNLPVLEAAACGLPVICTAGGSTDDFVTDDFALRVESTLARLRVEGVPEARGLAPDHDHLVHLMLCMADDEEFRVAARRAGPAYVTERFTWERIVDRLLPVLLPG